MDAVQFFNTIIEDDSLYVIDDKYTYDQYMKLDLSVNNEELQSFDINDPFAFEDYIQQKLEPVNCKVAYGGYNETRAIYRRSDHFYVEDPKEERNIHLGVDFWCKENTKVLSVLDGELHSFANNKGLGNYGPTIILKHQINETIFYSLYGHLSEDSLKDKMVGQRILKGEAIGFLGNPNVNGNYAPHLHFQLIFDIQNNFGDYKGVTSLNDRILDLNNCPNPKLILKGLR